MSTARAIVALTIVAASTGLCQFRQRPQLTEMNLDSYQDPVGADSKKSVLLGVTLSLILPGAGEWYAGNLSTGKYFMGADGVLWLSYAGISLRGSWIRDDARLFAGRHAGASVEGKEEQFEVDIGNFQSTDEYNQAKLRNREFDLIYDKPGYSWNWNTEKNRLEYRAERIRSDEYFQNAKFIVGALVINRVISAFSAWRSVNRHNKALDSSGGWDIKAEVQGGLPANQGLTISLSRSF